MSVRPPRVLAPLILACALCATLLAPAFASGAATQFGSSLAPGPAGAFGCSVKPSLYDYSGNFGLFTNSEPGGCTWSQAGVWGLNSGSDPRARSVPGDGRITSAEVLSGPNPSPLSITMIRQLAQPGVGDACCFFRSDTGPFPLTPNAVTTIPLDIPVERNTKEGVLGVDLISVSAETDCGSLPLRAVGPSNVLSIPDGDPMAGVFYPRMGQIANDSNGGRHEIQEGVPGYELLVRWTFCATGDVTCAGAPPVTPLTPPVASGPTGGTGGDRAAARQRRRCGEGRGSLRRPCLRRRRGLRRPTLAGPPGGRRVGGREEVETDHLRRRRLQDLCGRQEDGVGEAEPLRQEELLKKHARAAVSVRLTPKGGKATTSKLTLTRSGRQGR